MLSFAVAITMAFQNCDSTLSGYSRGNPSGKPANNGQGYTGKAYVNIAQDGSCGSPEAPRSIVEKNGDRYFQTVKDCKNQNPVDVTAEVNVEAYNTNALIFSSVLYERLDDSQRIFSSVACRGQGVFTMDGKTQHPFADVSMQATGQVEGPSGAPLFRGYVKTGVYDLSGNLTSSEHYEITRAVELTTPSAPARHFLIVNPRGEASSLVIPKVAPQFGNFQFLPGSGGSALAVNPMACYYH